MTLIQATNDFEQDVLSFMRTRLHFTISELDKFCGGSKWKRENYLRRLEREGFVRRCGRDGKTQFFTIWGEEDFASGEVPGPPLDSAASSSKRLNRLIEKARSAGAEIDTPAEGPSTPEEEEIWRYVSKRPYFLLADVETACPTSKNAIARFFRRLRNANVLRVWGLSEGKTFYTVKTDEEARDEARGKRGTKEGAIWTALRLQKRCRPKDLHAALKPARPDIGLKCVIDYCRVLRMAGYIKLSNRSRLLDGNSPIFLIKDTGPLPPAKQRMTVVVDTNSDKIVYAPGGRL